MPTQVERVAIVRGVADHGKELVAQRDSDTTELVVEFVASLPR